VFGLNPKTPEFEIHNLFARYGKIDNIQLIRDPMTRDSRGFCFVYYCNIVDAKSARNECNGLEVDGRRIRVDYSLTSRPNSPTPGQYRGYPRHRRHRDESRRHYRSRSSSLCRKCRRHSRSRSYGRYRYSSSRSYSRSPKHRRR
jgi:transformer-2 protein